MMIGFLLLIFSAILGSSSATDSSNFTVSDGHWRISFSTESELRCPYGVVACAGGDLAGDFLCTEQFSGLLCGNAESHHYIDWVAQDSVKCNDAVVASAIFVPSLVVLALLIFVCRNAGLAENEQPRQKLSLIRRAWGNRGTQSASSAAAQATYSGPKSTSLHRHGTANASFLHKLKILIFAIQVTSSLPSTLHTPFGAYFTGLARVFSLLSLSSLQAPLPWDCFAGAHLFSHVLGSTGGGGGNAASSRLSHPPTYLEQMEIATVLPLLGLFLATVVYLLHMEVLHLVTPATDTTDNTNTTTAATGSAVVGRRRSVLARYTAKYGTALWLLWYLGSAGIWQLLAGVLAGECINADTDGVYGGSDFTVMLKDVNVFCGRSSYQVGYLWAFIAGVLYIFFVPILQFLLVLRVRDVIQAERTSTSNSSTSTSNSSTSTGSSAVKGEMQPGGAASLCGAALLNCDTSLLECSSDSSDSSDSDCEGCSNRGSNRDSHSAAGERSSCKHSSGKHAHRNATDAKQGADETEKHKGKSKNTKVSMVGTATLSGFLFRKRNTVVYLSGVRLLFQAYKAEYYWWEVVDTVMRLSYAAALPSLFPYKTPLQLLVAIAMTLLFMQVLGHCKPYAKAADQHLAQCCLAQILLLLLCATAYELDLPEVRLRPLLVLDGVMCLAALSTPALFLYQMMWRSGYEDEGDRVQIEEKPVVAAGGENGIIGRHIVHQRHRGLARAGSQQIRIASAVRTGSGKPLAQSVLHRLAPATLPGSPRAHKPRTTASKQGYQDDRSLLDGLHCTPRTPTDRRRPSSHRNAAVPTSFHPSRDMAAFTQETVSYDLPSTEKKKKKKTRRNQQRRGSDRFESYDEHSDSSVLFGADSESSAEYKYGGELSTDSGNEDNFPRYPEHSPKRSTAAASPRHLRDGGQRTLMFPPSPESTPPSSDDDSSGGLYQMNDRTQQLRAPSSSANMQARTRPLPLNLSLATLAPLRQHASAAASTRAAAGPVLSSAAPIRRVSVAAAQRFLQRNTSYMAEVDGPTTEYGAQLDFSDAGMQQTETAQDDTTTADAAVPSGSPLVDYSTAAGIYPETDHNHSFDLSHFMEWSHKGSGESTAGPWERGGGHRLYRAESMDGSFISDRQLAPDETILGGGLTGEIGIHSHSDCELELQHSNIGDIQAPEPRTPPSSPGTDSSPETDTGREEGHGHVHLPGGLVCTLDTPGGTAEGGEEVGRNIVSIFSNRRNQSPRAATTPCTPRTPISRGGSMLSAVRNFGLRIVTSSPGTAGSPRASQTAATPTASATPLSGRQQSGVKGLEGELVVQAPATAQLFPPRSPPSQPAPARPIASRNTAYRPIGEGMEASRSLLLDTAAAHLEFDTWFDPESYFTASSNYERMDH